MLVDISNVLVKDGFITVRFDFDGCGKSDGDFDEMTIPKEIEDAHAVYEYCNILSYISEISLLGHSMGGVVASLLAAEMGSKIKSLILLSAAATIEEQAKEGKILGVQFDPENIPDYIEISDLKLGKDFIKTAQNLEMFLKASQYTGPVCIIHGRMDEVVKYSYSEEFQKIYSDRELYLLDNEDHVYSENHKIPIDIIEKFMEKNKVRS